MYDVDTEKGGVLERKERTMQFFALVEDWPGESMVYFRELPGCICSAATTEDVIKAAPGAVAEYFKWLKANDLPLLDEFDGTIEVVVRERMSAENDRLPYCFEADRIPPTDEEIERALGVAAAARATILDLYENVPPEALEKAIAPGSWSLKQHLQHLVESETWYISRISELPEPSFSDAELADLTLAFFDKAIDYEIFLRERTPEQRQQGYMADGEEWTVGKVLRRMAGHLREHYPWMKEIAQRVSV
jgi:predicted RNase H-like HicB family nuclease